MFKKEQQQVTDIVEVEFIQVHIRRDIELMVELLSVDQQ